MSMPIGRQGFLLFVGGVLSALLPAGASGAPSDEGSAGTGRGAVGGDADAYALIDSEGRLVGIHRIPSGSLVAPVVPGPGTTGHSVLPLSSADYGAVMSEPTYFRPGAPAR